MTKIKKYGKRTAAIVLVAVTLISAFLALPMTANAASKTVTVTFDYCYDTGGNIITFQQTTTNGDYTVGVPGEELCRIYADGEDAYCIEPGHSLHSGNEYAKFYKRGFLKLCAKIK